MVNFFKKKLNSMQGLKKSRVVRELPKPYVCKNVIVNKKKTGKVCKVNSFYTRLAAWLLGLIFLGVTIYSFFFSHLLMVTAVDIRGTENLSAKELLEIVSDNMAGKMGSLVRRNNLLVVDVRKMEMDLLDKYKIIKQVQIIKQFPDRLIVTLEERQSQLVYCVSGECFVIDEEGRAYASADFERGELGEKNLIVLRDDSSKRIMPDNFLMDLDFMRFVLSIESQLQMEDIPIKKEFSTPILISGDVRVETEAGWKIYFNKNLGVKGGIEMLKTVLKNSIPEDQIKDLEYVDVRLADKVYYKMRTNAIVENSDVSTQVPAENSSVDTAKKSDKKKK
ncbi:MAG: FtsQ-type POTRA domain-containing protein [Parcubacteria group bacterium]